MINWHTFFFVLFGLVACFFAVAVVVSNNIVRMAFYLIVSLGATAGLYFLAGAEFVGAMQLMIYVGGTLVLLIFGVMLTAKGPFVSMSTPSGNWVVAAFVGGTLLVLLLLTAYSVTDWGPQATASVEPAAVRPVRAAELGMSLLGLRINRLHAGETASGEAVDETGGPATGYLLPFEIVSVHLLVVLVGAAYLARAKKSSAR